MAKPLSFRATLDKKTPLAANTAVTLHDGTRVSFGARAKGCKSTDVRAALKLVDKARVADPKGTDEFGHTVSRSETYVSDDVSTAYNNECARVLEESKEAAGLTK
jgi:hypothetical protein